MSLSKKRLFIQTIPSVPLWGMNCTPTALLYRENNAPLIGFEAENAATGTLERAVELLKMAASFGYPATRIEPLVKQY